MNKYELVYIVDAHAAQGTKDEIAKQVADSVAKAEIKLVSSQMWLDRHKMSFPIQKIGEGNFPRGLVDDQPHRPFRRMGANIDHRARKTLVGHARHGEQKLTIKIV